MTTSATLLVSLMLAAGATTAWAEEGGEALKWHYFGTLGAARASSDRIQYVRDLSQPDGSSGGAWSGKPDSVLGVQVNYSLSDRVAVVAQALSRYRFDGTYRPEIMWAYAHFTSGNGTDLRVGRLGTDFFMRADSRLVGYANLAIRPSPDFFGQLPFFHIDGADLSHTLEVGHGLLKGKLFAGYTGEVVPFGAGSWDLGGSSMAGANLDYHLEDWSFRLGFAQLRVRHDWPFSSQLAALGVPAVTVDALSMGNKTGQYFSAGLIYDKGPLQVQGMLNKVTQESVGYPTYYSTYVLAGYRLGAFTPYAGVARSYTPPNQIDTSRLNAVQNYAVASTLGITRTNQTTWTAGVRWDFRRNMDLKAQWDGIRGKSDSVFLYPKDTPGWSGSTDVFSMALDFAF